MSNPKLLPEGERIHLTGAYQLVWDDIDKLIVVDARNCTPQTVTDCWRDGTKGLGNATETAIDDKIEEELLIVDTTLDPAVVERILNWIEEYLVAAGHNETVQAAARTAFEGYLIARDLRELYTQLLRLLSEEDSLHIVKTIQRYFAGLE